MEYLRNFARRLIAPVLALYWLVIFVGTHIPLPAHPSMGISDKLVHLVAYCGLSFLLGWATLRWRPTATGLGVALLVIMTYGTADELTQALVPSRTTDWRDWVANLCGGVLGLCLYLVTWRVCQVWISESCSVTETGSQAHVA